MSRTIHRTLSDEVIPPARFKDILTSILGMLLVVGSANFAAQWFLSNHTLNRATWLIKEKWAILENLNQKQDFLVLGDSSCNQGVPIDVLEQTFQAQGTNLCTIGNLTALNDAWMLDRYIQRWGAPKQVIIVHVYDVWHRQASSHWMSKIPLDALTYQRLNPQIDYSVKGKLEVFISRYLPLYTESDSLSNWIRFPKASQEKLASFVLDNNGFMPLEAPNPSRVREDSAFHLDQIAKRKFSLSSENRRALDQIATLAQQHDFQVYIANSPIYEGLYNQPEFRRYYETVQADLKKYVDEHENLHLVFSEPMMFKAEQMENSDHVVYSSAKVYAAQLADEIQRSQVPSP
jgi:hypothetical protein